LLNTVYPQHPVTVEGKMHGENTREDKIFIRRQIIRRGSNPLAALSIFQYSDAYHPHKYMANIYVHPEHEKKGMGDLLYNSMEKILLPRHPVKITSEVWEPHEQSVHFLEKRGFKLAATERESRLNLMEYNPAAFKASINKILDKGFTIQSLTKLREIDSLADEKVWKFEREVAPDMPWTDEITVPDFSVYKQHMFAHPRFIPKAWFLVLRGDEIAGLSNLWKSNIHGEIETGLTGVRRKFRRQGIATALKHVNLTWAKEQGYSFIRTENDSTNNGMLNINKQAGFEFMPSWLYFEKTNFQ